MPVTTRIEPIARDLAVFVNEFKSRDRSQVLADFAQGEINDAKEINRAALGRVPIYVVHVDGRKGAPLESVRPDGVIAVEFELSTDLFQFIFDTLNRFSPVKPTGTYKRSNRMFADGQEFTIGQNIPPADEYVFINSVPYAKKIERGFSSQSPDGVYQATALLARARFGNIAKIMYGFRQISFTDDVGGEASGRNPAVIVRLRT